MKHRKTIILVLLAMFVFDTSISAQVETKMPQNLTINGGSWTKVLKAGDPVTIFSYKQSGDTHSFGIYSDDYECEIDRKGILFNVASKYLNIPPKY